MKTIIMTSILTIGLLSNANASDLVCSAKVNDYTTGKISEQAIVITPTNAVDFKAEAGEVLVGELKLAVYRNIAGDSTHLSVSKKNDSTITPYLQMSSSSAYKLQAGQVLSLSTSVESANLQINCSLK